MKFDAASNNLEAVPPIRADGLEELYLSCNRISELPDLRCYPRLRVLDLQYNRLAEVDAALLPAGLEILLLSGNRGLARIANLGSLKKLSMLGLRGTCAKGTPIPEGVSMLN